MQNIVFSTNCNIDCQSCQIVEVLMMITERKGVRQLQCIFALVVVAVIVVVAVVVVAVVLKSKTFFGQFLFRISRLGNKSVEF